MFSASFRTNLLLFCSHRDHKDRRKQHSDSLSGSTTWLSAQQCFSHFFYFTNNMLFSLKDRSKPKQTSRSWLWRILHIHTTSTTDSHRHMHTEDEKERGRERRNEITLLSLHFVRTVIFPHEASHLSERRRRRDGGTEEGGWNTNQRQNTHLSHSPFSLSSVDSLCSWRNN